MEYGETVMWLVRVSFALGLAAAAAAAPVRAETVRAGGTGIGIALVGLLAEAYQRDHPETQVWVPESVGTAGAIKGLAAGKLEIGILARPLNSGEVEGAQAFTLCRTPLVFFTSALRKDVALWRPDLPALFANTLPAFAGGEVRILLRPSTDTGFIRLREIFPELAPIIAASREARGANLALTDQEAMDAVESSRSLVAFGALAPLLAERRKLRVVALDGVTPGGDRYPHDVPLVLALRGNGAVAARSFFEYALSPAAAPLLRANGCIPAAMGGG